MNVRNLIHELEKFPPETEILIPVGYTFHKLEVIREINVHSVFSYRDCQTYLRDIPEENREGGHIRFCLIIE